MTTARVGQVRPSQLLYTYGPGALVDLPHVSVLVSGIDAWASGPLVAPEVVEPRLLAAVRRCLGPGVAALRRPPHLAPTRNLFDDWARTGVPVAAFPSWVRCPLCDRIGRAGSALFPLKANIYRPEDTRYIHTNCAKAKRAPGAVPVRFVLACRRGHLDEFPWVAFVHRGMPCADPSMTMFEHGSSSRADEVMVRCACGAGRPMVDAFGERSRQNLPRCRGRHPHLRTFEEDGCTAAARTLLLGASNSWFSMSLRVLAIPSAASTLAQLVDDSWATLSEVDSPATLAFALRNVAMLARLSGEDVAAVWTQIEARRARVATDDEEDEEDEDLLGPEWVQLTNPTGVLSGHPDFTLREVPAAATFAWLVERVVLAERLREVVALVGFTRIDSPDELGASMRDGSGEGAKVAPICRGQASWVPCAEVRGEGIFIQLREDVVAAWETKVVDDPRIKVLSQAHRRWRRDRQLDPAPWPGVRYLALHSFAHLLMRELALECGYGSAAIRERLYARGGPDPMAGILIYTAAPDSEGTLGGLVGLGEPDNLGRLLAQALAHGALCASDPMCAEHVPSPDEAALHGAACHTCLFTPETSCERANRYLDRNLAVETLAGVGLGLFTPVLR